MKEKEKQNEEPQLREIKSTTASRSYTTGTGAGPGDCMSWEFFIALCRNGALKSEVYVCGMGWMSPDDVNYGSSGSSSSGSSGWSGSSGSSGSGSGGGVSGGGYGWENWPEWKGWDNFSGSSWNDIYGSGLSFTQKMERLNWAKLQAASYFGKDFPVRLPWPGETCGAANAKYENGEIVVCESFFTYSANDQASILWHEFYHMEHGHNGYSQQAGNIKLPHEMYLQPDEKMLECLKRQLKRDFDITGSYSDSATLEAALQYRLTVDTVRPSQWYRNEIETYKAEIRNKIYKSERYLCEERWTLWEFEQLLKIAEENE